MSAVTGTGVYFIVAGICVSTSVQVKEFGFYFVGIGEPLKVVECRFTDKNRLV